MDLSLDWDPELEEVEKRLFSLEGYVQNTSAPTFAAKLIAIDDMSERFLSETDPEGNAWVYWAESYASTAEQENVGILRKSEELYYSATDPDAFEVTENALYFNPSGLPEYWPVHQYSGGRKVPQRAYIGLSDQAQDEINEVFFQWLERGGEVFVRGGREIEAHVFRAPTGHFISALE